ncbi:hypothetical protein [Pseudazoarcus pumilus]|uniref:DUF3313 domain-containing protein n=1 Tax=Pseudazoarcus pumilus TaxID=2067960 RepID=A0A2I6S5X3_9RHOO|nr:hypothetical protein [Pseudazoarcus pumilus]AUN94638.1 hypothetical protein C0099_06615 [Pseudazoarcus pumilus]
MRILFRPLRLVKLGIFAALLSGCVSLADINAGFQRIDRQWQLEYQKTEDAYRYRVVEAPYSVVFEQVKKSFLDLSMPTQLDNISKGVIVAENAAPHPLTKDEWKAVVKEENPRIKELGGWMFRMEDDAKDYIVTVAATLVPVGETTVIRLDYKLDNPKYRSMGIIPSEHAPPLAVQLGSAKFWAALQHRLNSVSLPTPRRRGADEQMV